MLSAPLGTSHGRHIRRRGRRQVAVAAAVAVVAGVGGISTGSTPAVAADACLTPVVADFMVNQGLPSFTSLTRGKSTLVKYFLAAPSCAPAGSSIRITNGSLLVGSHPTPVEVSALLPLPPIGPLGTAPVPSAASDPLFVVPGSLISPPGTDRVTLAFTATLNFTATTANGTQTSDKLVVTARQDGKVVSALVERAGNSLRVLTVPMGDAGTVTAPKSADSQFPSAARAALSNGMTSLSRVLPVADGVGDLLTGSGRGLRYTVNGGMLNLGSHTDPQSRAQVNYMSTGRYCGKSSHYTYIQQQLNTIRTNWNSMNPLAPADVAYGTVWQALSDGPNTGVTGCIEGYADVNGTAAWGRVIDEVPGGRAGLTGTLAEMELLHTSGAVVDSTLTANGVPRGDAGFHSTNLQADVSAPERAWNTATRSWIGNDKTAMHYFTDGTWNDNTSLLEKPDFDLLQCRLTPGASCPSAGTIGRAAAGEPTASAFFVSGYTDGTAAGTDVHTYLDDDTNYERPVPSSDFRFVQRNALGAIVADDGVRVAQTHSDHDGTGSGSGHRLIGFLGTEIEASSTTQRIELWKGNPTSAGSVLLHRRNRNAAPQILGASVAGNTVSVSAGDEAPGDLRLDLFLACPEGTSPVINALKPTVVEGIAAFTGSYDTSLACPSPTLVYRVSDGYLTAEQRDVAPASAGGPTGTAAIYSPNKSLAVTQGQVIALAGDGRDPADKPAAELVWTVTGPTAPVSAIPSGERSQAVPPPGGWAPGTYRVALTAKDTAGGVFASTSSSMTVLADTDLDGIADVDDNEPCYPAGSVDDPRTPVLDSDGDALPNITDPSPCASDLTAVANFSPTNLQRTSAGNPVTVKLTESAVDLRTLDAGDLSIVQVAGHRLATPIPALSWHVTDARSGTVQFDRTALCQFLSANRYLGYVPLVVAAPRKGLRAIDPLSPSVFP